MAPFFRGHAGGRLIRTGAGGSQREARAPLWPDLRPVQPGAILLHRFWRPDGPETLCLNAIRTEKGNQEEKGFVTPA